MRGLHGLSQQGVWVPFWTPKSWKRTPQNTQIQLCGISKNLNLKLIIEFFHLLIISMTLFNDIMPYFDEFIHVYGWNMSITWSPLKIWTPNNFTTAKFRHPVSKSWLRHWGVVQAVFPTTLTSLYTVVPPIYKGWQWDVAWEAGRFNPFIVQYPCEMMSECYDQGLNRKWLGRFYS